jgi:hypothetical protein
MRNQYPLESTSAMLSEHAPQPREVFEIHRAQARADIAPL